MEEAEAPTRQATFDLFLRLHSMGAVARELNAAGHRTRRGGPWSDVQVARILECPSAIGSYEINRSDEDPAGLRRKTAKSERRKVECEPLVSRETWDRAMKLIQGKRARREAGDEESTPLRGLVWCGCGQKMRQAAGDVKFVCPKCALRIAGADLEAVFAEDFSDVVASHPSLMSALGESSVLREGKARLVALESEVSEATKQRAAVEQMFGEAAISKLRFEELHPPLEALVRQADSQIAVLRRKLAARRHEEPAQPIDTHAWNAAWASWPASRRCRIIHTFVESFVITGDEIEVRYLFPEPSASKETSPPQQISTPTYQPQTGGPIYIRLPKPGTACPYSGLSRAKLNELILPNERNNFSAPVASKSLRQKGAQRGIRLVLLESLMAYLSGSV